MSNRRKIRHCLSVVNFLAKSKFCDKLIGCCRQLRIHASCIFHPPSTWVFGFVHLSSQTDNFFFIALLTSYNSNHADCQWNYPSHASVPPLNNDAIVFPVYAPNTLSMTPIVTLKSSKEERPRL